MKHNLTWYLLSLCVLMPVALSGCNKPAEGTVENNFASPTPRLFLTPVQATHPRRGEIAAFFETTSRVEAESRVEVMFKGAGQCLSVQAEVGERVSQGDVLALLERDELEAQLRQARVSVRQQQTAYEIAEQSFREGIGASIERDNARFAHEQAKASLELVEIQLRHQTLYAPISGVITQRTIQPGMVVSPGMPAFTIVDSDSFTLPISVPEKELARLQIGQMARARIDAFPDREFIARIRRINPSIDPMSGTVRVVLDFDESDRPLLREAAFSRVRLIMDTRPDALLAPRDAVLEEQGRPFVYLLEEAASDNAMLEGVTQDKTVYIARRREITTGLEQGDQVEVVGGLDEDALIVIMGQHSLKPDAYVTITNLDEALAVRRAMTLDEALEAAKSSEGALPSADRARRARVEMQL